MTKPWCMRWDTIWNNGFGLRPLKINEIWPWNCRKVDHIWNNGTGCNQWNFIIKMGSEWMKYFSGFREQFSMKSHNKFSQKWMKSWVKFERKLTRIWLQFDLKMTQFEWGGTTFWIMDLGWGVIKKWDNILNNGWGHD